MPNRAIILLAIMDEPQPDDALERFLGERCRYEPGHYLPFADFYREFQAWLPANQRDDWSRIRLSRMLRRGYPVVARKANQKHIGNLAWR